MHERGTRGAREVHERGTRGAREEHERGTRGAREVHRLTFLRPKNHPDKQYFPHIFIKFFTRFTILYLLQITIHLYIYLTAVLRREVILQRRELRCRNVKRRSHVLSGISLNGVRFKERWRRGYDVMRPFRRPEFRVRRGVLTRW